MCGHDRVLQDLLTTEGPNVSVDMINGKRPVHDAGAAANEARDLDDAMRTRPIHLAASVGCAEVIDLLVLAGAEVNVSDRHGNTPVGTAAAKGYLDAVEVRHVLFSNQKEGPHAQQSPLTPQSRAKVLLRHGAGGSDFTLLTESQKRGGRKGALPLSFLAAAGGNIKVYISQSIWCHQGANLSACSFHNLLPDHHRPWRCCWSGPVGRSKRERWSMPWSRGRARRLFTSPQKMGAMSWWPSCSRKALVLCAP